MPPIIQSQIQSGPADGWQDGTMQADDALYPERRRTRRELVKHFTPYKNTQLGFFVIDQEKNSQGELAVVKKIWPFKSFFPSKLAHESTWNTKVMNIML